MKFSADAGRGERIRTSDSCVPNAVLYQAELHPDWAQGRPKHKVVYGFLGSPNPLGFLGLTLQHEIQEAQQGRLIGRISHHGQGLTSECTLLQGRLPGIGKCV